MAINEMVLDGYGKAAIRAEIEICEGLRTNYNYIDK